MISGPQGTWFNDGTPRPAPVIQHLDIRGAIVVREDGYYPPSSFVRLAGKQADHVSDLGELRFAGGGGLPAARPNIRAVFDPKIVRECDEIERRFGI